MKLTTKIISIAAILALSSCGSSKLTTKEAAYPNMYSEKPTTILLMPPINNTTDVTAKDYYYTSLAVPLCERGFYVVSPLLSMDILKQESAYDSEMFIDGNVSPFKKVFGADAVLFTRINSWEKNALMATITVNIEYILKSTTTNEILFERKGELVLSTGSGATASGGLIGLAVQMTADAVSTALTKHVEAARKCNAYVLTDMPQGKYGTKYTIDGKEKSQGKVFKGTVSR